ncbi:MAG: exodeoxyribonuclease V subunit alpha, partial [Gammaproteobacteria bacterium]|nr:exodeoxyribonuclease V subunit alpha [Gammaproteobacteria bacterium]
MGRSPLPASTELLAALDRWVEAGALRALDVALTRFIAEDGDESDPAVLLALALTSERNGHGHVCLDLAGALQNPRLLLGHLRDDEPLNPTLRAELSGWLTGLSLSDWTTRLSASPAVASPAVRARLPIGSAPAIDQGPAPFVLAGTPAQPLLYLRRYWRYEQQIRVGIEQRLAV